MVYSFWASHTRRESLLCAGAPPLVLHARAHMLPALGHTQHRDALRNPGTPAGDPLLTNETIEHVTSVVAKHGSDAWWQLPIEQLLPPSLAHMAPKLRKGEDTMDVWFDSGSSWAGVVQAGKEAGLRFPADLYLEGSDQHRGERAGRGGSMDLVEVWAECHGVSVEVFVACMWRSDHRLTSATPLCCAARRLVPEQPADGSRGDGPGAVPAGADARLCAGREGRQDEQEPGERADGLPQAADLARAAQAPGPTQPFADTRRQTHSELCLPSIITLIHHNHPRATWSTRAL